MLSAIISTQFVHTSTYFRSALLLTALLPHTGRSFRLGISGVPGVGKSTFIETLGLLLIEQEENEEAEAAEDPRGGERT